MLKAQIKWLQLPEDYNLVYAVKHNGILYINSNYSGSDNLALQLKPLIQAKAKKNQTLSDGRGQKGIQNSGEVKQVRTDKELAKIAGVSHDTI